MTRNEYIYNFAKYMHDLYEGYAIEEKWVTNKECHKKPFADLPEENKNTMLKLAEQILIDFGRLDK